MAFGGIDAPDHDSILCRPIEMTNVVAGPGEGCRICSYACERCRSMIILGYMVYY